MFNTQSDEFYTVLVGTDPENAGTVNRSCMFETQDEAIDYIKDNSSWDCRPSGGNMDNVKISPDLATRAICLFGEELFTVPITAIKLYKEE